MSRCYCGVLGGIECRQCSGREASVTTTTSTSTDKELERLVEAITLEDGRPLQSAIDLAKAWLDGAPVHQSWPAKIHALVANARAEKEQTT